MSWDRCVHSPDSAVVRATDFATVARAGRSDATTLKALQVGDGLLDRRERSRVGGTEVAVDRTLLHMVSVRMIL